MRPQHLVFALLMAAAAGTNWVASKIAVDTLPPFLTVAMRFGILTVVLLPFARIFPGQMRNVFLVSVTLGVMQFGFMFQSLSLADDVSTMAITNQLYVPFSTIMGIVFLGERIGLVRSLAIAVAFAGVVVMGFDPAAFRQIDAMLFVTLSAMSLAVSSLFMRKLDGITVFQLQFWLAALAAPQMLVLSLIFEYDRWASVPDASTVAWSAFVYTIFVGTLFHAGWYFLLRRYPVSTVAPLMLLLPVFGIGSGIAVYGDVLTPQVSLGGALTLVGVAIIVFRTREGVGGEIDFDKKPRDDREAPKG
ncbi:MAG: EamA family transporter [Proteobacteria bacterium]|nr:EamA family transporter [Pseudomonadota bacterium]MDA1057614.1 EamA family transporter [Pseudomonadota bacterium]